MAGSVGACARTGFCCMLIPFAWSPKDLRDSYESWKDGKTNPALVAQDIDMLYPMLAGRCKGKRRIKNHSGKEVWQYVYGPCRNLDWSIVDGKVTAGCAVHENKPRMCSGFPYYESRRVVKMTQADPGENRGTFKGCGFNADPEAGQDIETFGDGLVALDEEEK